MFRIEKGDKIFWVLAVALGICLTALAITIGYAARVV